jgi:hypothetical protein
MSGCRQPLLRLEASSYTHTHSLTHSHSHSHSTSSTHYVSPLLLYANIQLRTTHHNTLIHPPPPQIPSQAQSCYLEAIENYAEWKRDTVAIGASLQKKKQQPPPTCQPQPQPQPQPQSQPHPQPQSRAAPQAGLSLPRVHGVTPPPPSHTSHLVLPSVSGGLLVTPAPSAVAPQSGRSEWDAPDEDERAFSSSSGLPIAFTAVGRTATVMPSATVLASAPQCYLAVFGLPLLTPFENLVLSCGRSLGCVGGVTLHAFRGCFLLSFPSLDSCQHALRSFPPVLSGFGTRLEITTTRYGCVCVCVCVCVRV